MGSCGCAGVGSAVVVVGMGFGLRSFLGDLVVEVEFGSMRGVMVYLVVMRVCKLRIVSLGVYGGVRRRMDLRLWVGLGGGE